MSASHAAVEISEIKADLKDQVNTEEVAKKETQAKLKASMDKCSITEHKLPHEELCKMWNTDLKLGLTSQAAKFALERDGKNALTPKEQVWWLWKALPHILGGFSLLLWAASIMCFVVYGLDGSTENLTLAIVLVVVVLGTGAFSYYQELQSDNTMAALLKKVPRECYILRDGAWGIVKIEDIVIGDMVKIENGKQLPADVIIIESLGIKVDNSSLTGEPEPLKRSPECSNPDKAHESKNVAFFGTACVEGNGIGMVARTGDRTTLGTIAQAVIQTDKKEPLLKQEVEHFVHIISIIAFSIGIIFFICALSMKYKLVDAVIFSIGIIVANVPEGLLATVTLGLTITASRMAEEAVLVKSTLIIETLGSVTCIASDKTGTLTCNQMSVCHMIYPDGTLINEVMQRSRRRSEKDAAKMMVISKAHEPYKTYYSVLLEQAAICNHAHFDEDKENMAKDIQDRKTSGDASESALLKFAQANGNANIFRNKFPEVRCLPFNSRNKFMITVHKIRDDVLGTIGFRLITKGAPERVLGRCKFYTDITDGQVKPLTEKILETITASNTKLASNGERVLGFAERILRLGEMITLKIKGKDQTFTISEDFNFEADDVDSCNFLLDDFRFTGMLSLEDPPRSSVPGSIESCHAASIKVIMVTGDHPLTGRSIAAQVGILPPSAGGNLAPLYNIALPAAERNDTTKQGVVVSGDQLNSLTEEDWDYILTREGIVFARTLPTQKQDIVKRLQSPKAGLDHVVAVTGDGVNDSPALKEAMVGIAMNSGSEVAKEAADLILLDDNFTAIVKGIEEGRLIFANLKKSICYTLTSNVPELIPFLVQIIYRCPLALTTILILCIDLGTDLAPAIAFAYESSESDIMLKPPRDRKKDKLVTLSLVSTAYLQLGIIQGVCAYVIWLNVLHRHGFRKDFVMYSKTGFDWTQPDSTTCFENFLHDNEHIVDGCADFEYRNFALREAQTAFLASIVLCQIGGALACKTRLSSLFTHGLANWQLSMGFLQEILLILLLVYVPGLNHAFKTERIATEDWLISIPFSIAVLVYDEVRKWWLRRNPDHPFYSWIYY